MYNSLFGVNKEADELLDMIGLSREDFGRFRDAYVSKTGTEIIVFTRCGGGNREAYKNNIEKVKNEFYLTNYDDDFDDTYMSIEYSVPSGYEERCIELSKTMDVRTGPEKLSQGLKDIENGIISDRAQAMIDNLLKQMKLF